VVAALVGAVASPLSPLASVPPLALVGVLVVPPTSVMVAVVSPDVDPPDESEQPQSPTTIPILRAIRHAIPALMRAPQAPVKARRRHARAAGRATPRTM